MGAFDDALARSAQDAATQPLPQGAPARMRHLVAGLDGSTRAAAEALGVDQRTVQRYMRDEIKRPRPALAAALENQLRARWQPGLQRRALDAAAKNGFTIESRARFGYTAPGGSTDEPRTRLITQHIPPATARPLIDAYKRGETEAALQRKLEEALALHYFRDGGRRAHGLDVEFTDIDYIDVDL